MSECNRSYDSVQKIDESASAPIFEPHATITTGTVLSLDSSFKYAAMATPAAPSTSFLHEVAMPRIAAAISCSATVIQQSTKSIQYDSVKHSVQISHIGQCQCGQMTTRKCQQVSVGARFGEMLQSHFYE